jgi:peptidoglycan/xylan/chitin deacetylase (PgdA/CDA1 family)
MFFDKDLKGTDLPPKTLSLTYDDGPGPDTLELGRYLHTEGISATFFIMGRHAEDRGDVLAQLSAWGHCLGNHTYSHPGLVALAEAGGDVVAEIARTDALLRPHAAPPAVYLRAPYGNWRQKEPGTEQDRDTSIVADALNRSGQFPDYVGPINWDISAADYDFWKRGASAADCAAAYRDKIHRIGRGIVLMHDSSEDPAVRPHNRALRTTQILVPALQAEGFRFVSLDEVPQVQSAVEALKNCQVAPLPSPRQACQIDITTA